MLNAKLRDKRNENILRSGPKTFKFKNNYGTNKFRTENNSDFAEGAELKTSVKSKSLVPHESFASELLFRCMTKN